MLAESMMALASVAGNTVIAAATTDAWESAKSGFARLLGRGDPDRTKVAERRLAETHERLTAFTAAELELARSALETQWATRLADLLKEDPRVEADLRALVDNVQAALQGTAASAVDHSVAAGRDVNVTAASGGIAAAVINGPVAPPNPTRPGSGSR